MSTGGSPSAPELATVRALLADAAGHYKAALRASPQAVRYLAGRGVGGAVAARFGLGYARPEWRDLGKVLQRFDDATVVASGLLVVTDGKPQGRRFDRFRGRVMFPIRTRDGAIAGFGARALDGTDPKYLNSPEGPGFKKRELLYGLYEAQAAIQAEGLAVVVEGYLDVIVPAQAGFAAVVGTLGVACSRAQITELLTLTRHLVFCFDGDVAGRDAAGRALEAVLPLATDDVTVSFVFLPEGHDPDSFVREEGIDAFRGAVGAAVPLLQFLQESVALGCDLRHAEGRALCVHRAGSLWAVMPQSAARTALLEYCAGVVQLSTDRLRAFWRG
jgi:DNA primase